jgi:hypothetical protein
VSTDVVEVLVVPDELGTLTVWPMRRRLSDEIPLYEASVSVLTPFAAAIPESVSPETTVWVELVVPVEVDVVPSSDESGTLTVWPMITRLSDEIPLKDASVSVLIPLAAAIPESVSPETTAWG